MSVCTFDIKIGAGAGGITLDASQIPAYHVAEMCVLLLLGFSLFCPFQSEFKGGTQSERFTLIEDNFNKLLSFLPDLTLRSEYPSSVNGLAEVTFKLELLPLMLATAFFVTSLGDLIRSSLANACVFL